MLGTAEEEIINIERCKKCSGDVINSTSPILTRRGFVMENN